MSAVVLGKRSSSCFFEDNQQFLHHHAVGAGAGATPPPVPLSKRIRCSSSPIQSFSPTRPSPSSPSPSSVTPPPASFDTTARNSIRNSGSSQALAHLRSLFPDMDEQLLEKALEASGNDLDSAIRRLNELHLGFNEENLSSAASISSEGISTIGQPSPEGIMANIGGIAVSEKPAPVENFPADGPEWVELLVKEMMSASDMDDARARASRVLEVLEKSIAGRVSADAAQSFHKENMTLKEQVEGLLHDNGILKRAVAIQHERQKEFDERNQEVQHLKQLVSQYQEQLRTLEVANYALAMHLRQAQQSSSMPGRFNPDVF